MDLNADPEGVCQEAVLAKVMCLESENFLVVLHLETPHQWSVGRNNRRVEYLEQKKVRQF